MNHFLTQKVGGGRGLTGMTGPAGVAGAVGVTGATGAVGPAGAAGVDGAVGAVGVAGVDGATGSAGTAGTDGATGPAGLAGPAGPAGAAGIRLGLPYNSIGNATTTITTGNKSYWFIVVISETTTISGFAAYLTSGSDTMRFGIYRGYLRASTSDVITLVGQSTAGAPANTGLPYTRRAITAVAGQSLTFVPGDYMTIAMHSQGTTNGFVASPALGLGITEISYVSSTNYAAAGFPASLTSSSIFGNNLQKPCFDLY